MARNRYDAFISYRHSEPDSEIAARLHKKLESFRLPKTVAAKIRKTRLHRVFCDEAELAVSDDLSQAIETALQNSKYLIAVCSPEYLKSVWCQKEITKFLEFSDRKHVLLVLAEGDPENAFPEVLLYNDVIEEDEFGRKRKVRKPHEPLAAVIAICIFFLFKISKQNDEISDDGIVFMENSGSVFHIFRAGERKTCWGNLGRGRYEVLFDQSGHL